jgi:hypothetical protein
VEAIEPKASMVVAVPSSWLQVCLFILLRFLIIIAGHHICQVHADEIIHSFTQLAQHGDSLLFFGTDLASSFSPALFALHTQQDQDLKELEPSPKSR